MVENTNGGGKQPPRKSFLYYYGLVMLIVMLLNIFLFPSMMDRTQQVRFDQFSDQLKEDNVDEVYVTTNNEIVYTLKNDNKNTAWNVTYKTGEIPGVNLYETPETLGYDRMAAVVGANEQFPHRDILVIDAGTCITYEFIDSKGQYHGGNISPGMQMRFKALHQFTGRLPLVDTNGRKLPMGRDTETAIRAGVMKGMEYEISGYIESMKHKYPELLVFLTGGDDFSFDSSVKSIIFADRFLVLKGLNRILNYNNGRI